MRTSLVIALAACGCTQTLAQPQARPQKPAQLQPRQIPHPSLEAAIAKSIDHSHLLGLAVAIVDHGNIVLEKGYGYTDFDKATPITPDTIFAIGSLTKQFTAAAVLRLVDQGKLRLSDRVGTFLPALDRNITVQQLLWQTAGLPEYAYGINLGKTADELVQVIASTPPDFAPGTKWQYSNSNYLVLGRIVEIVSKQTYADFMRTEVFAPAHLTSTSACSADVPQARPSLSTSGPAGSLEKGKDIDFTFYGGAGTICSTVTDLVRWQDALFGGKVVSPSSLAVMTTAGTLTSGSPIHYAAGLIPDLLATHRRIWHNGGVPNGYESQLAWYPDDRLQIVLLTNTASKPIAETLGHLESVLARDVLHIVPPPAVDKSLTREELEHFTGRFKYAPLEAQITIDRDHLHVHIDGGVDARLLFQGDGRFVLEHEHEVEYRFVDANTLDVSKDGTKLATLVRTAN